MLNINKDKLILKQYAFDKKLVRKYDSAVYSLVGISKNKKKIIKIEFLKHPLKKNSLIEEAKILKNLNKKNCLSSPILLDYGLLEKKNLSYFNKFLNGQKINKRPSYLVTNYIENNCKPDLVDIILTVCEQKKFGIFHADIKRSNIRYDDKKGICFFIDFDQAEIIPKKIRELSIGRFIQWCNLLDNRKYNIATNNCFRQIKDIFSKILLNKIIINNKLNLKFIIFYKYLQFKKNFFLYYFTNLNLIYDQINVRSNLFKIINLKKYKKILCLGFDYDIWNFFYYKRKSFFYLYDNDNLVFRFLHVINNFLGLKKNFFLLKNIDINFFFYDIIIIPDILFLSKNKKIIKLIKKKAKKIFFCFELKTNNFNFFNIKAIHLTENKQSLFFKSEENCICYLKKNFKNFKIKKIQLDETSKLIYELSKK